MVRTARMCLATTRLMAVRVGTRIARRILDARTFEMEPRVEPDGTVWYTVRSSRLLGPTERIAQWWYSLLVHQLYVYYLSAVESLGDATHEEKLLALVVGHGLLAVSGLPLSPRTLDDTLGALQIVHSCETRCLSTGFFHTNEWQHARTPRPGQTLPPEDAVA